jgi:hypothetical protein
VITINFDETPPDTTTVEPTVAGVEEHRSTADGDEIDLSS